MSIVGISEKEKRAVRAWIETKKRMPVPHFPISPSSMIPTNRQSRLTDGIASLIRFDALLHPFLSQFSFHH
jgi:hypothetical protein